MKIRRLSTAAVLVAMSAGVLAGATPAVASSRASATTASAGEHPSLMEQWYRRGPYPTLAACNAALLEVFTDLLITDCYYYNGDPRPGMRGYYYDIYL
ncbi:hypothetical protein ABT340_11625 [Streptosporangium sp. NPDC000239]|uniref:hypothetical protein n=1 Tax=Streptosporangium sp. NPDC000239 TaxID=3154248 RepID=UPI00331B31D0